MSVPTQIPSPPSRANAEAAAFDLDELAVVLTAYPIGAIRGIVPVRTGAGSSHKLAVTADKGVYFVKRRTATAELVTKAQYGHLVQLRLARHGIPVPAVLMSTVGRTIHPWKQYFYEVFDFMPGGRWSQTVAESTLAGDMLARLHQSLLTLPPDPRALGTPYHSSRAVHSSFSRLQQPGGPNIPLIRAVAQLYQLAVTAAHEAGIARWPAQLIHGDYHSGNLLYEGGAVTAILDFDSLHSGPRLLDVANAAMQFSLVSSHPDPARWPSEVSMAHFVAVTAAYDVRHPLSEPECIALPWLMVQALIAEVVIPLAASGKFGNWGLVESLEMVRRKGEWIRDHAVEMSGRILGSHAGSEGAPQ